MYLQTRSDVYTVIRKLEVCPAAGRCQPGDLSCAEKADEVARPGTVSATIRVAWVAGR